MEKRSINIDDFVNKNKYTEFAMLIARCIIDEKKIDVKLTGNRTILLHLIKALKNSKKLFAVLSSDIMIDSDQFRRLKKRTTNSIKRFEKSSGLEWPV